MVQIRRPKTGYAEHRREFAAAKGLPTNLGDSPEVSQGEHVSPPGPAAVSPDDSPARSHRREQPGAAEEKLRLKFTIQAPNPGTSDYFDRAVALMGEGKALRLIVARAFDELEAAIGAGEAVPREAYPTDRSRSANTSRHVSTALYASAKRALDPMDLLPPGSFGRELAMAALARYLRLAS